MTSTMMATDQMFIADPTVYTVEKLIRKRKRQVRLICCFVEKYRKKINLPNPLMGMIVLFILRWVLSLAFIKYV